MYCKGFYAAWPNNTITTSPAGYTAVSTAQTDVDISHCMESMARPLMYRDGLMRLYFEDAAVSSQVSQAQVDIMMISTCNASQGTTQRREETGKEEG